MSRPKEAPYGSWKSTIVASSVAAGSVGLEQIVLDGDDVYWIERRPAEGGRQVIVRLGADGQRADVTPPPFNARTRIHGYGGQAYTTSGGTIYFSNYADGRLYRQEPGLLPTPITPEGVFAYGEPIIDRWRNRLICVREDYTVPSPGPYGRAPVLAGATPGQGAGWPEGITTSVSNEPVDAIVAVKVEGDSSLPMVAQNDRASLAQNEISAGVQVLVQGSDFYDAPRLSPNGKKLAWLAWSHPDMPWDGAELWVGDILADGTVGNRRLVAGGAEESVFQPEWSPDGTLFFVSDRSGWWNLYRWHAEQVEALHPMEAEFGVPAWVLGLRTYGFVSTKQLACTYCEKGRWRLGLLDTVSLALEPIRAPYTDISGVRAGNPGPRGVPRPRPIADLSRARDFGEARAGGQATFIAGSPLEPASIVRFDLATHRLEVLCEAAEVQIHPGDLSAPEAIEFPTSDGATAHALFYPPHNRRFFAPAGERPPLLVMCHGGPTGAASTGLSLSTQFWTSRGFAVVHVNYGGSTGYGRAYRRRLDGQWGVVDVDDCVNAARYLVAQGMADGKRLAIHGSSAGGYTALCALTFHDLFRAGAVYYGIGDLEALAQETHKFESRYQFRLIGPYPEHRDLYRERSPIHFADRLSCALILFQGLDDRIVPPSQSDAIYRVVRQKGLPVAYMSFEGEGHGFRRADTIRRSLEAELYFYSRVFGFKLVEPCENVQIENLQSPASFAGRSPASEPNAPLGVCGQVTS